MIAAPPKTGKAQRLQPPSPQSQASQPRIAGGQSIKVSARHNKIVAKFRVACLDGLELTDEIRDCDVPEGHTENYAEHTRLLCAVARRLKRLTRAVSAVAAHARKGAA